jgi:transposase-like protein
MALTKTLELIRTRRRWTAQDAEAVLAAAERTDLSLRAFAEQHGIDVQRLYRWKRELRREVSDVEPVRFEELVVRRSKMENDAAGIEIVVPSGCVVRIGADFDESMLRRVLAVLEGRAS